MISNVKLTNNGKSEAKKKKNEIRKAVDYRRRIRFSHELGRNMDNALLLEFCLIALEATSVTV